MPLILLGDLKIAVTRKRIRNVHLRVHPPDGRVTISAPVSARMRVIEAFAASRVEWIRRQQQRVREQPREASRQFVTGESHHLWGRPHLLTVVERVGREEVVADDGRITMLTRPGSDTARRARVMHTWHKTVLEEALPPLIQKWEGQLRVQVKGYYLRRMTTRWGTCNYRSKVIRLNTELVTRPSHLLEYVVVHEMVHLIVPNHGARFVRLMNEHFPSWRDARAELNGR